MSSADHWYELRLLPHIVAYEWRKATAFRGGFLLRELLRGLARPAVMMMVYIAMFRSSAVTDIRGYTLPDLLAYLVWSTALQKCLSDGQTLTLSEQIFDGYITKYLVMPVNYFSLVWGQFVQFTAVQLATAAVFWTIGAVLLPELWPYPASLAALAQATVLLLLGAACYLLVYFILCALAFWVDVTWSLRVMFNFAAVFIAGALVPIRLMPERVEQVFATLFPYWTTYAPAEILLGRQGTAEFWHGCSVLVLWLLALQGLAIFTWRRGLLRYAGVGA